MKHIVSGYYPNCVNELLSQFFLQPTRSLTTSVLNNFFSVIYNSVRAVLNAFETNKNRAFSQFVLVKRLRQAELHT